MVKSILALLLISSIYLWGQDQNNELSKLRKRVLTLEKENTILKREWQLCLNAYEKTMGVN